jgi:hypothetical protein
VLLNARIMPMSVTHPVFNTFFHDIPRRHIRPPPRPKRAHGIDENNDSSKRLQVIINFNNDIGDYMEWSGGGWYPVNLQ